MTLQELIFYCATTENGKRDIEKCYEKGRADAIGPIRAIIIESEKMMWCADKTLEKIREQLKKGE